MTLISVGVDVCWRSVVAFPDSSRETSWLGMIRQSKSISSFISKIPKKKTDVQFWFLLKEHSAGAFFDGCQIFVKIGVRSINKQFRVVVFQTEGHFALNFGNESGRDATRCACSFLAS